VVQPGLTCDKLDFDGILDGDDSDKEFNIDLTPEDYKTGNVLPGLYDVVICGEVRDSTLGDIEKKDCKVVFVTIKDPCDPPTLVRLPNYENQVLTITDNAKTSYTMPEATIEPDYCPYTAKLEISKLNDGSTAIDSLPEGTYTDQTSFLFNFYYDKDLKPIRPVPQTQTVTLTVTAMSKYSTGTQKTVESDSWELSFKNPCKDPAFVEIVPSELPDIDYQLYSGEKSTRHPAFSQVFNPAVHTLCGPL